jgi:hypothetical protein
MALAAVLPVMLPVTVLPQWRHPGEHLHTQPIHGLQLHQHHQLLPHQLLEIYALVLLL